MVDFLKVMIKIFLIFLFVFSLKCLAIEAHKAEYILSLYESTQSSGIYGIEGKSIYTIKEECSGWHTNEELIVNFQLQDSAKSQLISKWTTFETFSGKSYQFDMTEKINDQDTSNFLGFANISKNNQQAVYISDKEYQIKLDAKIEFPIMQLKNIITAAKLNKKVYNSNLFLGSELQGTYNVVSAIIGPQTPKINNKFDSILVQDLYWPIYLAFYKPALELEKPEYTISAKLQENGVILEYIIDYGDFSIISSLKKISSVNKNKC